MKIKVYMVKEGLSRAEFSQTIGVTPTTLSGYCSGDRMPSLDTVREIHNATRGAVSFADFFNDRLDPRLEIAQ